MARTIPTLCVAPVAQLDRAMRFVPLGCWFKSSRARHMKTETPVQGKFVVASDATFVREWLSIHCRFN